MSGEFSISAVPATTTNNWKYRQPLSKRVSWWPDWEFTNDLLLSPRRPSLTHVCLSARVASDTMATVIDVAFSVENRSDTRYRNLRVIAVVLDDAGMIQNRKDQKAVSELRDLEMGDVHTARVKWHRDTPPDNCHLLLVLEDENHTMIDVVSGDFVLA